MYLEICIIQFIQKLEKSFFLICGLSVCMICDFTNAHIKTCFLQVGYSLIFTKCISKTAIKFIIPVYMSIHNVFLKNINLLFDITDLQK